MNPLLFLFPEEEILFAQLKTACGITWNDDIEKAIFKFAQDVAGHKVTPYGVNMRFWLCVFKVALFDAEDVEIMMRIEFERIMTEIFHESPEFGAQVIEAYHRTTSTEVLNDGWGPSDG